MLAKIQNILLLILLMNTLLFANSAETYTIEMKIIKISILNIALKLSDFEIQLIADTNKQ